MSVAASAASLAGRMLVEHLQELGKQNDQAIEKAYAGIKETWRLEREQLVRQRLDKLEAHVSVTQEDFDEHVRIQLQYENDAKSEPSDERRRMLAYAAAETPCSDLTLSQLEAVQRTLRGLSPYEVEALHTIQCVLREGDSQVNEGESLLDAISRHLREKAEYARAVGRTWGSEAFEALHAAGLIRRAWPEEVGEPAFRITERGSHVVQLLEAFVLAQQTPDPLRPA